MKNFILLAILLLTSVFIKAQIPPIMVCNPAGTSCAPYKTLDDAYNNANAGDYIYLPGGNFQLTVPIKKEIHIIGAGFEPIGANVTGITNISGDIILGDNDSNVDNTSLEGFYLTGNIRYGVQTVNNLKIESCNFNLLDAINCDLERTVNNSKILRCVVRDYICFGNCGETRGINNIISNNILQSGIYRIKNSLVNNNIIQARAYYCYWDCSFATVLYSNDCIVKNNIINSGGSTSGNISFLNNINLGANYDNAINNQNNISNQALADTFVNSTVLTYSNANDYHLKSTSPGKNAGDDGTDIGIYGGATPWKENAIPSNPHIYFKNIGNTVDGSGNLPVQIKVSAQ